jgi:predicted  nucleic acid-binding Zn-ribbon protein
MPTPITEEQYRKLKAEVDTAKAEMERARGAVDTMLASLKEEYGCNDLNEAKVKLAKLNTKREEAKEAFEEAMQDYQKTWKA